LADVALVVMREHGRACVWYGDPQLCQDIAEHAETLRDWVDGLFYKRDGLTADECADALKAEIWSVRPRLSELRRMGRIVETDQRRKNRSGMTATVWKRAVFIAPKQSELF
jgi:predicted ArsR family transcriptional regulator